MRPLGISRATDVPAALFGVTAAESQMCWFEPELLLQSVQRRPFIMAGFRSANLTQCSPLLVPRCAGVLLAPRHSPGDLRLLQHPGVSQLVSMFLMGNSEGSKRQPEETT